MTEAEAKKILERLLSVDILVGNEHEAVSVAIKALEKQSVMKVKTKLIEEEIYNAGGFTRKVKRYFCPVCDSFIEHGKHCYNCGQKLDCSEV